MEDHQNTYEVRLGQYLAEAERCVPGASDTWREFLNSLEDHSLDAGARDVLDGIRRELFSQKLMIDEDVYGGDNLSDACDSAADCLEEGYVDPYEMTESDIRRAELRVYTLQNLIKYLLLMRSQSFVEVERANRETRDDFRDNLFAEGGFVQFTLGDLMHLQDKFGDADLEAIMSILETFKMVRNVVLGNPELLVDEIELRYFLNELDKFLRELESRRAFTKLAVLKIVGKELLEAQSVVLEGTI